MRCATGIRLVRTATYTAVLGLALTVAAGTADATLLVFDRCGGSPDAAVSGLCSGGTINPLYGDRATATSMNGGLFRYIEDGEGWTPNVVADYGPDPASIYGWSTGYRPLANVLWVDRSVGRLEVTLQADPGFLVLLYNFELAIYSDSTSQVEVGRIRVSDQDNVNWLDLQDYGLRDAETFFFFTPARSAPGGHLTISFDVTNLPVGESREYVAIDNIRFGQTSDATPVPEPGSLLLLACGGTLSALRFRRTARGG